MLSLNILPEEGGGGRRIFFSLGGGMVIRGNGGQTGRSVVVNRE